MRLRPHTVLGILAIGASAVSCIPFAHSRCNSSLSAEACEDLERATRERLERYAPDRSEVGGSAITRSLRQSPPAPAFAPPSVGATAAAGPDIEQALSVFVGPHDYPPHEYGAYGIVAFRSAQTTGTRPRFIRVCEAYVATLPPTSTAAVPLNQVMVTVWPVSTDALADSLSELTDTLERKEGCGEAVDHYHMPTALVALRQSGKTMLGNGPFLLAWSPASSKGKKDALVLIADLSNLNSDEEFLDRFQKWRDDIESNPEIFKNNWTVDRVRSAIRDWADHWGNIFLSSGAASDGG